MKLTVDILESEDELQYVNPHETAAHLHDSGCGESQEDASLRPWDVHNLGCSQLTVMPRSHLSTLPHRRSLLFICKAMALNIALTYNTQTGPCCQRVTLTVEILILMSTAL